MRPAVQVDPFVIVGSQLQKGTAWATGLAVTEPRTNIDVGAGAGAGTLVLARRFPNAQVTALDKSAEMLDHALKAAPGDGPESLERRGDLVVGWHRTGLAARTSQALPR